MIRLDKQQVTMTRTKQSNRQPLSSQSFENKTMTDEDGQTWVETKPGNWIKSEVFLASQERLRRIKLRADVDLMNISQIKHKLKDLGQEITDPPRNWRKKDWVEKLRSVLFSDL